MKKFVLAFCVAAAFTVVGASAETWEDGFTTRLMKLMTSDPSFTDVVITDIDQNGTPEAFLLKKGTNGIIDSGITLKNNILITVNTPKNVTGACLEDISVYDCGGSFVYVGKEVSRYSSEILYFELVFDGETLTCVPTEKSKYSSYPTIAYKDVYSRDLHTEGYPNRSKIESFINSYDVPMQIAAKPTSAMLSVDGNSVNVSGFNIEGNNYYKIRDIAMILRGTDSRFDLGWSNGVIEVITGERYKAVGSELEEVKSAGEISAATSRILVDGEERQLAGYNIDGSNYFKIRDLGNLVGFDVEWDDVAQTIVLTTGE